MSPEVEAFLHKPTSTWSYVVSDPATGEAAVIDPVMDYDAASGNTSHQSAENIVQYVRDHGFSVRWVLDTHAHADHLTAVAYIREQLGGAVGVGRGICGVQAAFKKILNLDDDFATDGSQFDRLFGDNETFKVGNIEARAIPTPGHTGDSVSYLIGDALFVGDTLFLPELGTARCDFPGGDAATLYDSIQRLFALPDDTRLFVLHDYPPAGRSAAYETTVGEQKQNNVHIGADVSRERFVELREQRDRTLSMPKLIFPALQVNLRAGRLPAAEENGTAYFKIPLNIRL